MLKRGDAATGSLLDKNSPYHIQAIAARLNTGHREPQMPNEALVITGKEMWYVAPMRAVMQTKQPAMVYPIHTQSHDCHQDNPLPTIMEDDIIHVFCANVNMV